MLIIGVVFAAIQLRSSKGEMVSTITVDAKCPSLTTLEFTNHFTGDGMKNPYDTTESGVTGTANKGQMLIADGTCTFVSGSAIPTITVSVAEGGREAHNKIIQCE